MKWNGFGKTCFCLQRDLEKLEIIEIALSGDERKEA
jgi:hypothetical protein